MDFMNMDMLNIRRAVADDDKYMHKISNDKRLC
jgi:hypothetical protein